MKVLVASILLSAVILNSCIESNSTTVTKTLDAPSIISGEAQGTTYTISYYGSREISKSGVDSLLNTIDLSMSNWVSQSMISRFNAGKDSVVIDQHFLRNLTASYIFNRETQGAFNPLVKPLVDYYGFGIESKKIESIDSNKIESLLLDTSLDSIKILYGNRVMGIMDIMLSSTIQDSMVLLNNNECQLDFNAIAQGYSADATAMYLMQQGAESYLIEIGGEMVTRGVKKNGAKWKVGIDRPEENASQRVLEAAIEVEDKGIATSGNYRKFYESNGTKYHHTIDPITGYPAKHNLLSATVIASTSAAADALATSFMVMGLEKSVAYLESKKNGVQAFLIYSNANGEYEYYISEKLKPTLEIKN